MTSPGTTDAADLDGQARIRKQRPLDRASGNLERQLAALTFDYA